MEDGIHRPELIDRCAGCVSRRAFLERAGLAAATVAFLAACGDGQFGPAGPSGPIATTTIKVSDFPGLGTVSQLVNVTGQITVKRTGATTFAAFSRACTHQGFRLELFQSGFACAFHGSQFDNDGRVTVGPATRNLDSLSVSYDQTTDLLTIS